MASTMAGSLVEDLHKNVENSKVLVVGAGGIGCELIKNLVLTGFHDIHLIDLDTIDVSNLNRQFLFRKEHVRKSKAQVARQSALQFNPDAQIQAFHDSIMSPEYGVEYFKQFTVVMNALDNRAARNHVNRMCLAANVPLIESGTAGYLGQVTVIKKGLTECYECQPKPAQKTFPGCTIRNTPSEPIHCIVWAKHLFNQLFGQHDPDEEVSPDTEDPEAAGDAGASALSSEAKANATGGIERKSTRTWAEEHDFDAVKLFNKLFRDDVKYLLSMHNLWKKRRPPTPLDLDNLPEIAGPSSQNDGQHLIKDQRVWGLQECFEKFRDSIGTLKEDLKHEGEGGMLVWDKDDEAAMDFVTATANIRAAIFGIQIKSRFDIKSMAGNIIPAIATTNAIIAGLIVMEGLKILQGQIQQCKSVYLNRHSNPRKKLLVPCMLDKPNPKCYVCSEKPEVAVKLNTTKVTVKVLEEKILKGALGMVAPDVEIDDGKGTILLSSEEGETEDNLPKLLSDFGINNGSRLKCDDFLQVYNVVISIVHIESFEDHEQEFELVGDVSQLQAEAEKATASAAEVATVANGEGDSAPPADEEDDLMVVEEDMISAANSGRSTPRLPAKKRHAEEDVGAPSKKIRRDAGDSVEVGDDDDEIIML